LNPLYCHWRDIWQDVREKRLVLIDLRSEKEFALGSVPHAINIPLLNNDERHIVGKTYKEVGRIEATQLGMEIFSRKSAVFLEKIWSHAHAESRVVGLYCWRGGMRSGMVAKWVASSGLKPIVLTGGYKTFRRQVIAINDEVASRELVVLMGRTGSGKTDLIRTMPEHTPVIDLEGLAFHRGSAFGGFAQTQPSPTQQNFENLLAEKILTLGGASRILFEIENFIGPCAVPKLLRDRIAASPMVFVERTFDDRVSRLTAEYVPAWNDYVREQFLQSLQLLRTHLSGEDYATIAEAAVSGDVRTIVTMLLRLRYDRSYDKSIEKRKDQYIASFNLSADEEGARTFLTKYLEG